MTRCRKQLRSETLTFRSINTCDSLMCYYNTFKEHSSNKTVRVTSELVRYRHAIANKRDTYATQKTTDKKCTKKYSCYRVDTRTEKRIISSHGDGI